MNKRTGIRPNIVFVFRSFSDIQASIFGHIVLRSVLSKSFFEQISSCFQRFTTAFLVEVGGTSKRSLSRIISVFISFYQVSIETFGFSISSFSYIKLTNLNSQFNFCSISQLRFQSVFNQEDFQTTVVNFSVKFYQTIYSLDIQNFFFIVLFSKFQFQFQVLQSSFQLTTF